MGYVESDAAARRARPGRPPSRNRFGWPGDQDPLHTRSDDTVIVAILGGSVAGGFAGPGVPELERRLQELPRFAGRRFVFVPLALAGYKQPQQLMALSWLLSLGGEFDLVINLDGFNEVALHPVENARTGTFAGFPRQWHYQLAELPQRPLDELAYQRVQRTRLAEQHSLPLMRHSVLGNFVWRLRDSQAAAEVHQAQAALAELGAAQSSFAQTGPQHAYADEAEMMRHLALIWREASLQLHRLSRANGSEYYHFLQPNQYVPGSKPLSPRELRVAFDPEHPYRRGVEAGYPLLVEAGAELAGQGVAFFDLSRLFENVEESVYSDDCCHFKRLGYQLIAEAMAEAISGRVEEQSEGSGGG